MELESIILIIAIAGIVIFVVNAFALQRRKKLAAYAQSQGLQFSYEKDKGFQNRYPSFTCMRQGHTRYAFNIMQGTKNGKTVTAFDYHYVTGHGKERSVHFFSALIFRSPLPLEPLFIRPEHLFDKLSDFFGYNDIDFESAEFSRKFFVKAEKRRWAYDVIHQQTIEYLLKAPKFHIQFGPTDIMAWRNRRFSEKDFDDAFDVIQTLLELLPDYVKKQQMEKTESAV